MIHSLQLCFSWSPTSSFHPQRYKPIPSIWRNAQSCHRVHCLPLSMAHSKTQLHILVHFLWRRQWHPTPVLLPGKSHGRRSLVGCSPWGCWGSDTTERPFHFHFSLSCIGEGNGNPLQCSCLENPRNRGTWWAAVYGVTQSRTRLKWLSRSSTFSEEYSFYKRGTKSSSKIPHNGRVLTLQI